MRSHIEASFLSTVRRPTGALPCIPQGRTIPLTLAALVIASASVALVYPAQAQTLDGAFHAQPSSDRTLQKKDRATHITTVPGDGDPRSVETPSATSLSDLSDTPGVQTAASYLLPEGGEPDAGSAESIALIPDLLPPLELAASDRPVDDDLSFRFNPGASQAKGPHLGVGASLSNFDVYVEGGVRTFGYELGYREAPEVGEIGYAAVFFDRRSPDGIFLNGGNDGGNDAELPNDHDPWVHRFGGGVAASLLLDENTTAVAGVNYQRVSIREAAFTDDLEVRDEFGNRLTVSDDGRDDLLTINLGLLQENLNDLEDPTSGTRWRVGVDQSIPIGESDILYNRVSGGYSRYFPLGTQQTLLVTVQGGHVFGDLPPYEAFSLGGTNSVRGYRTGELGTGRSFAYASAEYRFPLLGELDVPLIDINRVGGAVFIDAATDFDSEDEVIGRPAEVRNKAGSGFGAGVGLRFATDPIGLIRVDLGISDQGDVRLHFGVGERF